MDPHTTPVLTSSFSNNLPLNIVHWPFAFRHEENQFMVFAEHLYNVDFLISKLWSIRSTDFPWSSRITSCSMSIHIAIIYLSIMLKRAVADENTFLKPDWAKCNKLNV